VNLFNTSQFDSDQDRWGDGCDFCPGATAPIDASQGFNPDQGFLFDTDGDGKDDSCFAPLI